MRSLQDRRDVRDFKTVLSVRCQSNLRSATRERFLNTFGRNRIVGCVAGRLVIELKTSLVNSRLIKNCSFGQTRGLLSRESLVNPRRERVGQARNRQVM